MPELAAFRGLRYDALAVPDLGAVLCPPYDVISESERARLAALDERNAVHVELPASYDDAARRFQGWIADGTLRRDDRPLVYAYEQRYGAADGTERSARGLFCRLRLEAFGPDSGVRPHESTMSGPKEDRFRLLSAVRANLSPVLLTYDDSAAGAASRTLMDQLTSNPPAVEAIGPGGLVNRLWLADPTDSAAAEALLRLASVAPLTIADGHHRYETALRYSREPGASADAAWVLALLYDAHSGDLSLLPWHRVMRGSPNGGSGWLEAAARWFDVRAAESVETLADALAQPEPGLLGLWTGAGGAVLHVDRASVAPFLPDAASETLRWLDVTVLSSTLAAMTDAPFAELAADGRLSYVSDSREAIQMVQSGRADAAFLVRPTPIDAVLEVAAAGEYMPAKSTFFHPKAATGLVFNPIE